MSTGKKSDVTTITPVWVLLSRLAGSVALLAALANILVCVERGIWSDRIAFLPFAIAVPVLVLCLAINLRWLVSLFSRRQTWVGANVIIMIVFAVGFLVMVSVINVRNDFARFDLSEEAWHTLSESTKQLLKDIAKPLKVSVIFSETNPYFQDIMDLLDLYEYESKQVSVKHLDWDRLDKNQRELDDLKKRLQAKIVANSLIIEYDGKLKSIRQDEIIQRQYRGQKMPPLESFAGEQAITGTILSLLQEKQPTLYFLTGHGERSHDGMDPSTDLSECAEALRRNGFSTLKKLDLTSTSGVPDDCDILIIAAPQNPLGQDEIAALRKYLKNGGKLMLMLEPAQQSGLEPLLKEIGVSARTDLLALDYIVNLVGQLEIVAETSPANYGYHQITERMNEVRMLFLAACPLEAPQIARQDLDINPLVYLSPRSWGESSAAREKLGYTPDEDLKGPITVAMAISKRQPTPAGHTMRIVVIGDVDFVSNRVIQNQIAPIPGNQDFFIYAIRWLAEQKELVSIPPKNLMPRQIDASKHHLIPAMFWLSLIALPALSVFVGLSVWVFRRR